MKVIIYGGNGWIGGMIIQELIGRNIQYVVATTRMDVYRTCISEILQYKSIGYTHLLCCAGRTHGSIDGKDYTTIDYLEQPGKLKENLRDNLLGPVQLAFICKQLDLHYTYIGTGCIYKYDDTHPVPGKTIPIPFYEDDSPNFTGSSYSCVKGVTDRLMEFLPCLNCRIRMPISSIRSPRNFIDKLIEYEYICSTPNSMTVLDDFIPIIVDMMLKDRVGTYNMTNPGYITHNQILNMYREIVDSNFTWKNFSAEEQNAVLCAERSNNYLSTYKIEAEYAIPDIITSIRTVLIRIKDNMVL